MGMQVAYRICTKVPQTGDIQRHQGRRRSDTGSAMPQKRNRDHRSRMLPGSFPHVGKDTAQILGIRNCRIPEREEFPHDI